jgi:crossover junction endodeoxyribonuclease RuvC
MILGLDISTKCTGWCLMGDEGDIVSCGAISFTAKETFQEKTRIFYNAISSLFEENDINIVGIEDQFFNRNANTLKILARFSGVACLITDLNNARFVFKTPKNVKKVFTDNGSASKKDIIDTVKNKYGLEIENDNISDAIAVAYTIFLSEKD